VKTKTILAHSEFLVGSKCICG